MTVYVQRFPADLWRRFRAKCMVDRQTSGEKLAEIVAAELEREE
jgi:hypothetical protein